MPESVPPSSNNDVFRKKENRKKVLTIIFLLFFWPVGLILTWFLSPWSRKVKIIITVSIVFLLPAFLIGTMILFIVLFSYFFNGEYDAFHHIIEEFHWLQWPEL